MSNRVGACQVCKKGHNSCDWDPINGIGCTVCRSRTIKQPIHHCTDANGRALADRPASTFAMNIRHKCDRCAKQRKWACSWLHQDSTSNAWRQACTQCVSAGVACEWEGNLIQDCSQNPPLKGPPFQLINPPQLAAAPGPPPGPALAPAPAFFPPAMPALAPNPAPAPDQSNAPAPLPAPLGPQALQRLSHNMASQHQEQAIQGQASGGGGVFVPPPLAGRRKRDDEDDDDFQDEDDDAHLPRSKRQRYGELTGSDLLNQVAIRGQPAEPSEFERLQQQGNQPGPPSAQPPQTTRRNPTRGARFQVPSYEIAQATSPPANRHGPGFSQEEAPLAGNVPAGPAGGFSPFGAQEQAGGGPNEGSNAQHRFQAMDLARRFAAWNLGGAALPQEDPNRPIVDAPPSVGTGLYEYREQPLLGPDNSALYPANHPERVNMEQFRFVTKNEYPGALPLASIPTERIPNDNPVASQCNEPLRMVRNAFGGNVEVCEKPTDHVCEDRRHPAVEDAIDRRWFVCDTCNDFSKFVITKPPVGITEEDIMAMRAYFCNECGSRTDNYYFAYTGYRVWGIDPNAQPSSELPNHLRTGQPGEPLGGLKGDPLPMTGCACAEKLLGRTLCIAHRTTLADDMIRQAKIMQEWRLNMYGKPVCPKCRRRVGVDAWWNVHDDGSGSFGNIANKGGHGKQRAWACMVCQEFVLTKAGDEVAGKGVVAGYNNWIPNFDSNELTERYHAIEAASRQPQDQQDVEMAGA